MLKLLCLFLALITAAVLPFTGNQAVLYSFSTTQNATDCELLFTDADSGALVFKGNLSKHYSLIVPGYVFTPLHKYNESLNALNDKCNLSIENVTLNITPMNVWSIKRVQLDNSISAYYQKPYYLALKIPLCPPLEDKECLFINGIANAIYNHGDQSVKLIDVDETNLITYTALLHYFDIYSYYPRIIFNLTLCYNSDQVTNSYLQAGKIYYLEVLSDTSIYITLSSLIGIATVTKFVSTEIITESPVTAVLFVISFILLIGAVIGCGILYWKYRKALTVHQPIPFADIEAEV